MSFIVYIIFYILNSTAQTLDFNSIVQNTNPQNCPQCSAKEHSTNHDSLKFNSFFCDLGVDKIYVRELAFSQNSNLKMDLFKNPTVQMKGDDAEYLGRTTNQIIESVKRSQNIKPEAYVNGNFFGYYPSPPPTPQTQMQSRGLIWSKRNGLLSPIRASDQSKDSGGNYFIIWDKTGPFSLKFLYNCKDKKCTFELVQSENRKLSENIETELKKANSTQQFQEIITKFFPTTTLIMQSNMPLRKEGEFKCPYTKDELDEIEVANENAENEDEFKKIPWQCIRAARTIMCLEKDTNRTKFYVTTPTLVDYAAKGFGESNACLSNCAITFNLDGQLSSQIAMKAKPNDKSLKVLYPPAQTEDLSKPTYRPVQNFFLFYQ